MSRLNSRFAAVAAIDAYLDSVFMDRPARASKGRGRPGTTSFVAALIDEALRR